MQCMRKTKGTEGEYLAIVAESATHLPLRNNARSILPL